MTLISTKPACPEHQDMARRTFSKPSMLVAAHQLTYADKWGRQRQGWQVTLRHLGHTFSGYGDSFYAALNQVRSQWEDFILADRLGILDEVIRRGRLTAAMEQDICDCLTSGGGSIAP